MFIPQLFTILTALYLINFVSANDFSQTTIEKRSEIIQPNQISLLKKRKSDDKDQSKDSKDSSGLLYHWPRIDGSLEEALSLVNVTPPVLQTGYWYFTVEFYETYIKLLSSNQTQKGFDFLFNQMVKFEKEFQQTCFSITNSTAKSFNRKNTLARIICFPYNEDYLKIDQDGIAIPFEAGCWERDKNGNPNKPLFDYTNDILKKFKWDKPTAIQQVEKLKKGLGLNSSNSSQS